MFYISKLIGNLIEPATFLTALAFLACVLLMTRRPAAKLFAQRLLIVLAICLFSLAVLPFGKWALLPLENRYASVALPESVDGIIMLTGDESPGTSEARGVPIAGWAAQRYVHIARLAQRYPQARLVVVGDTRPHKASGSLTTQSIAREVLQEIGVPLSRVTFEETSRNTHENAANAKKLLDPKAGETWLVVTSAFHMPRSVLCFMTEGWPVVPSPSDYYTDGRFSLSLYTHLSHNLNLLNIAAHEYYGLFSYWILGWTDKLWV